jgi:glycosyltransferase involved in cell wall biosynthesis
MYYCRAVQLRILRVADVVGTDGAGVSGFMLASSAALEDSGHIVEQWFHQDLLPQIKTPRVRRLLVPWVILAKVLRNRRRLNLDVIEIHEPLSAPYALAARLQPELPPLAVISHGLEERGWLSVRENERRHGRSVPLRRRLTVGVTLIAQARLGLALSSAVLVLSSEDKEYLAARRHIPADRIFTIFSGVSVGANATEEIGSGVYRKNVLFIGSWIERKGIEALTAAWKTVAAREPDAQLTIAGIGDDSERAARAATHALANVRIIPSFPHVALSDLMEENSVFVLPSLYEGMPLVVLEAAAAGLPCVVSAVCGNLDIFRVSDPRADGGILVAPYDSEALAAAVLELVGDERLRRQLGSAAAVRAREFSWVGNAARCVSAYQAAIGTQARRRSRVDARPE